MLPLLYPLYSPETRRKFILQSFNTEDIKNPVTLKSITRALEQLDELAF